MSDKILLNIEIIVETCCFFVTTNSVCFQFLFEKWQVQPVVILCSMLIYGTWSTQESIIIISSTFEIDFLFSNTLNGYDNNNLKIFFDFIVVGCGWGFYLSLNDCEISMQVCYQSFCSQLARK